MIDSGNFFAYGFYSPQLHADQPASTFSFSLSRWSIPASGFLGKSGIINILWKATTRELAEIHAQAAFPGAEFKGVLTNRNFLLVEGAEPLPVIGAPILLGGFENGPIQRAERPQALRLIVNNDMYEPKSA